MNRKALRDSIDQRKRDGEKHLAALKSEVDKARAALEDCEQKRLERALAAAARRFDDEGRLLQKFVDDKEHELRQDAAEVINSLRRWLIDQRDMSQSKVTAAGRQRHKALNDAILSLSELELIGGPVLPAAERLRASIPGDFSELVERPDKKFEKCPPVLVGS